MSKACMDFDGRIERVNEWLREAGNGDVADLIRDLRAELAGVTAECQQRHDAMESAAWAEKALRAELHIADRRAALAAQLPDKWRERAVALTDDRQVMRDDRVAARILRTCADQLAEALAGLLAKK